MDLRPADQDLFDSMCSISSSIKITAEDLCAALWSPSIVEPAEGNAPCGSYEWFFSIEDGEYLGALTHHEDGGTRWKVWSGKASYQRKIVEGLVRHIQSAGYTVELI